MRERRQREKSFRRLKDRAKKEKISDEKIIALSEIKLTLIRRFAGKRQEKQPLCVLSYQLELYKNIHCKKIFHFRIKLPVSGKIL